MPQCKSWYTTVAILLENGTTNETDVQEIISFIRNISKPCQGDKQG